MTSINFDVNDALKNYMSDPATIATPEADPRLVDCETEPEALTNSLINPVLNAIVDSVAESPENIARVEHLDSLQFLLKHTSFLSTHALSKLFDLITSGISVEADIVYNDTNADGEELASHKLLLEIYGFLLQWAIACVETKAAEKSSNAPAARARGKPKKAAPQDRDKDANWDPSMQLMTALDVMCKVLKIKLSTIFQTTSERDTFIGLLTRPVYLILENEQRTKSTPIRMHAFKVLCMAVKHHGHGYAAQISIVQNLTYFEHLSEPMAEFLHVLAEQYDYPQLADETLREISSKEFNSNDTKGPKSVSSFIAKLSEVEPRLVIKQMTMLAKLLDSESYTLRCCIIEVCGNMIAYLSRQEERGENHKSQLNAFWSVMEDRFLDINPYCRTRTIQVYVKLCELETKFHKRRQKATELATRSLEDKSSHVRRNAIKLLGMLIKTHPFTALHGHQLQRKVWQERLDGVVAELDKLAPPDGAPAMDGRRDSAGVDTALLDEPTQVDSPQKKQPKEPTEEEKAAAIRKAQEEAATSEAMQKLSLERRYYADALRFIDVLHEAMGTICQLLGSKNKSEVIEAIDFLEICNAYNLEQSNVGIKRMLRLIWTKGNSDEGKGVQAHLIDCYKRLFFEAPDQFSAEETATYVARNMISLTFGTTPAELTSLEQLLGMMMKGGLIHDRIVAKLWQVYGIQAREISRKQRRGAIIVLGMLATANPEIMIGEVETMMRTGLGNLGRADLQLAKYTCIALRRINPTGRQAKEGSPQFSRLANDHPLLKRLADITEVQSDSKEWFGVAEQAINAIYALAKHPDIFCSDVIRRKTKKLFAQPLYSHTRPGTATSSGTATMVSATAVSQDHSLDDKDGNKSRDTVGPPETQITSPSKPKSPQVPEDKQQGAIALSQLLFVVGHVAIKQIVHLELCEQDFKRRKAEKEKDAQAAKAAVDTVMSTPESSRGTRGRGGGRGRTRGRAPAAAGGGTVAAADAEVSVKQEPIDDELDMIGGTTEDDFTEAMSGIRERELLYGPHSLLARFGPLASELCANNTRYADRGLQAAATLCLAKLMCVSAAYCEDNLPLLITIMERSRDAVVRSNAVIALGDMAVCFNHLIDENTDFLYRRLADPVVSVKRTCLMTLTFLILAGQVKVKGQLGEMAKCLEDPDRRIADLARMFFSELATKNNAIYNHFVDMFSVLSAERNALPASASGSGGDHEDNETVHLSSGLSDESFRRIVKFLLGFVEKDRHAKQLAEKLAARLQRCTTERQWADVAFALSQLQHKNEEIAKVVAEGFKVVPTAV